MANTRVTTPVTDFDKSTSLPGLKIPSGDNSNQPAGANAAQGMIRNDTEETVDSSASAITHYNGTNWQYFAATESADPINGYYLVVAGGGGTAYGGGGAGGYLTNIGGTSIVLEKAITYTVTVGVGGVSRPGSNQPGGNGDPSEFSGTGITTITAAGGGGGNDANAGVSGGSGGGGGYLTSSGGTGNTPATTPSQGNNGGNGMGAGSQFAAGGGGGAFEAGENGNATSTTLGSNGGDGLENNITGTPTYYAGGGAGLKYYSGSNYVPTAGGQGGGGSGLGGPGGGGPGGTDGLGGGGGGFVSTGGSGVVIIKYPTANNITIASGTSPVAADLNATVAGSTTEKFTRFTATGAVTFTIS